MKPFLLPVYATLLTLAATSTAQAQSTPEWTFATLPASGEVSGTPGQTIGWGYTLRNLSQNRWLLTTIAEPSGPLEHASYVEPLAFSELLAPNSSNQVEPAEGTGLFRIQWDADAPVGYVNAGSFTIQAAWYDGDPFNGGNPIEEATPLSAPYKATVVPEPASLCAIGLGALCLWRRNRYSK